MGLDPSWEQVIREKPRKPRKRKKPSAAPKEKDIQKAILGYLALCGAIAIRVNSGGMRLGSKAEGNQRYIRFNDTPGCSDIVACLPRSGGLGVFCAIEVKRPGEQPKPHQRDFLDAVERAGGVAIVAHSVAELAEILRGKGFYAP